MADLAAADLSTVSSILARPRWGGISPSSSRACKATASTSTPIRQALSRVSCVPAGGDGIIARTIRGCTAVDCGSYAINGASVSDSYGSSVGGIGISASEASNCHAATAGSQSALDATIAINCFASNAGSGTALNAGTAQNCYGSATTGTGISIFFGVTQNCYGTATTGTGIHANIAMNCTGYNHGGGSGGRRLSVSTIAIGCYGECSGAGNIGLEAPIANSSLAWRRTRRRGIHHIPIQHAVSDCAGTRNNYARARARDLDDFGRRSCVILRESALLRF